MCVCVRVAWQFADAASDVLERPQGQMLDPSVAAQQLATQQALATGQAPPSPAAVAVASSPGRRSGDPVSQQPAASSQQPEASPSFASSRTLSLQRSILLGCLCSFGVCVCACDCAIANPGGVFVLVVVVVMIIRAGTLQTRCVSCSVSVRGMGRLVRVRRRPGCVTLQPAHPGARWRRRHERVAAGAAREEEEGRQAGGLRATRGQRDDEEEHRRNETRQK